jgi:transposase
MSQGTELMSKKETQRYAVISQVIAGQQSQALAAQQLGLSVRQIKRLCKAVRTGGSSALISKRRDQPSNRRICHARKSTIMTLVHAHYSDFGPQLASEYLASQHHQHISAETLRQWMTEAGLWQAKSRRKARQHPSRARREHAGELVQIDGSHHDWFEGRGQRCCLIAFIDDATSRVLAARFSSGETTQAYFAVMHAHISSHGVPLAYYSDRHGIFTKHDSEDPTPTQFERALLQLDIEPICARSPQAKGRVERLFQTLQDRMIKAMRLAGIRSIEQANAWLPQYLQAHNARFSVPARQEPDAHRPVQHTPEQLARICALHHQRQLSSALTCRFEGSQIWVDAKQESAPAKAAWVDIVQYADDRLEVLYRGQVLKMRHYALHEHLRKKRLEDDKTIHARVDSLVRQKRQIAQVALEIRVQEDLRRAGQEADTHVSPPPRALSRFGLRPAQLNARL